jgi:CBS domain-containing protein
MVWVNKEDFMQLKKVMSKNPECVSPATPIGQVASVMKTRDIGMVLVTENDRLVGTVTDRDSVIRGIAEGRDPRIAMTGDIMTRSTAYCFEDQDVTDAAHLMEERQIRRLAILNRDKKLVGVVSLGDLAVRIGDETMSGEVIKFVARPNASRPAA